MRRFDLLNFFYGLGAAIILVAALFKFLGWKGADVLFVVGLVGEAVIFLISGAQPVFKQKSYNWERIFPQLSRDSDETEAPKMSLDGAEMTQEQQIQHIMQSILSLNNSVENLNAATQKLTSYVERLETNYELVNTSTLDYHKEISNLKTKIAAANDKLREFDNYKF
ncbi:MAG: gliding motility protein GldL [Flavobacteriales bacterium]|nr:gliding motility protein GldL [Flavobacteriales bacterium]